MNLRRWLGILPALLILCTSLAGSPQERLLPWGPFRGANINHEFTDADAAVLRSWGANLVRINFHQLNLMDKQPPYPINATAVAALDRILDTCERHGLYAVIDPHTSPGLASPTSTSPTDLFWTDFSYHDHLIRLWSFLADRYKDRGDVIAGYDLLNEPSPPTGPNTVGTPADWNLLVRKLAAAIRAHDTKHTLVVEFPIFANAPGGLPPAQQMVDYLEPIADPNTVYSVHWYAPGEFTHQGVGNLPLGSPYPGIYRGREWNRELHRQLLASVATFQHRHNVPIYLGEFGAARWTGESGNRWMEDIAAIAEQFGWSWTYHSFRIASVWDVEKSNTDRSDETRYASTPRLELMKQLFSRNAAEEIRATAEQLVQAASYERGPLAPYQFFSLFGENLGAPGGLGLLLNGEGQISRSLAGTEVLIAGEPAPLVYVSPGQVNGIVPASVAGLDNATVEIRRGGHRTTFSVPTGRTFPGIFAADGSGRGQAAAQNQDGSMNGESNPEARGRVVVLYASGAGLLNTPLPSGAIAAQPLPAPQSTVEVTIGGEPARMEYAGTSLGMPLGLLQVNVRIPQNAPVGNQVPVVLRIAGKATTQSVTLAIR